MQEGDKEREVQVSGTENSVRSVNLADGNLLADFCGFQL